MKKLKILSLFDGIGACQVALKNLGIEYDYFASEIDPYAIKVTQNNFPNTVQLGDVRGIEYCPEEEYGDILYYNKPLGNHNIYGTGDIKQEFYYEEDAEGITPLPLKFDLLCGGPPCQDISIAKKDRKGLDGERSGLFFEYVRILKEVKPKFFILENVASASKDVIKEMTSHLYGIEPIIINSALLTAQQRKRVYFVGALQKDGTYKKVEIEQPQDKNKTVWEILELDPNIKVENFDDFIQISEDRLSGLLGFYKTTKRLGHFNSGGQGDRVYSRFGKSVCLSANGGGRGAKCGLYLTKHNEIRKLTPIECERLQGFPEVKKSIDINFNEMQVIPNLINNYEVCLDHIKKSAGVVMKNHKSLKHVGSVENDNLAETALSVEKLSNIKHLQINKPVEIVVHINLEGSVQVSLNQEKLKLYVNFVENQKKYPLVQLTQVVAQQLVGILTMSGNEAQHGKEALLVNTPNFIRQENGKWFVEMCGQEIEEYVKGVVVNQISKTQNTTATILEAGQSSLSLDWIKTILPYFVLSVIDLSIPDKMLIKNLSKISIKVSQGYTFGISNTRRYQCLGNSFTVPVIEHILKTILK